MCDVTKLRGKMIFSNRFKGVITPGQPGLTARMKRLSAGSSIPSRRVEHASTVIKRHYDKDEVWEVSGILSILSSELQFGEQTLSEFDRIMKRVTREYRGL
jgi:hypothetical protein